MKVLNYIHLKNMFVHKDKRIEFEAGKNYIVGSIGTGKTLITESIAFALFGTVALRGKATSYKDTEVELSFNYNEETFTFSNFNIFSTCENLQIYLLFILELNKNLI